MGTTRLSAGTLTRRITIEEPVYTQRLDGEHEITDWNEVCQRWAAFDDSFSGKEFLAALQVNAQITHQITIYYTPAITPAMRIMFKGREFQIAYVKHPQESQRITMIFAIERL